MKKLLYLAFALILTGCAEHWRNISADAREQILACNQGKADGDSLGVFWHCGKAADVPLPPECLASEEASRRPKCAAIAKGEALNAGLTSTGQTAITAGTLFAP
jgi:hypothetical protein